jgi:hypothetical protein
MPTPDTIQLTPVAADAKAKPGTGARSPATAAGSASGPQPVLATARLVRIHLPSSYPLLTRGFHLVNEYGYER